MYKGEVNTLEFDVSELILSMYEQLPLLEKMRYKSTYTAVSSGNWSSYYSFNKNRVNQEVKELICILEENSDSKSTVCSATILSILNRGKVLLGEEWLLKVQRLIKSIDSSIERDVLDVIDSVIPNPVFQLCVVKVFKEEVEAFETKMDEIIQGVQDAEHSDVLSDLNTIKSKFVEHKDLLKKIPLFNEVLQVVHSCVEGLPNDANQEIMKFMIKETASMIVHEQLG